MRYKLLLILCLLGPVCDLAPDNLLSNCFQLDFADVWTNVLNIVVKCVCFLMDFIILPYFKSVACILYSVTTFIDVHMYIWFMMHDFVYVYHHTGHSVRGFYCFRDTYLTPLAALCVLSLLYAPALSDVNIIIMTS